MLPTGYPFQAPQVFIDMALHKNIIQHCSQYIGSMNLVTVPYLSNWSSFQGRQQSNLVDLLGHILAVMKQNPPIDTSPGAMGTNAPGYGGYQQQ